MHINSCRCFYIWLQFSLHFDVNLAKICGSAASSLIRFFFFFLNCPLLLNDNVIGVYWSVEYSSKKEPGVNLQPCITLETPSCISVCHDISYIIVSVC